VGASVVTQASGDRIYAIGDIHGCIEEPSILLEHLEKKESLTDDDLVVFLGDYIDRGHNSAQVIDLMIEFKKSHSNTRFLKGNHEDMLLDFLGFGGKLGQAFLYNGGLETIQSYGLSVFSPAEEMVKAIPVAHLDFYKSLESVLVADSFICVHAGLNPLRDLDSQNDNDVYWIREDFISNIHKFEKTVVFGHTPHREILVNMPYKLGLDTGLVFGNKISCLELKSGKVMEVSKGEGKVKIKKIDLSKG